MEKKYFTSNKKSSLNEKKKYFTLNEKKKYFS